MQAPRTCGAVQRSGVERLPHPYPSRWDGIPRSPRPVLSDCRGRAVRIVVVSEFSGVFAYVYRYIELVKLKQSKEYERCLTGRRPSPLSASNLLRKNIVKISLMKQSSPHRAAGRSRTSHVWRMPGVIPPEDYQRGGELPGTSGATRYARLRRSAMVGLPGRAKPRTLSPSAAPRIPGRSPPARRPCPPRLRG